MSNNKYKINIEPSKINKLLLNRIYLGDCLELLPKISDKSINMILCDLPYNKTRNSWDNIIDLNLLWKEYERIIKNNGAIVLTAIQPFTSTLVNSNLKLFKYELIWEKNKSTGFLNAKKMPLRNHESILIFYKKLPVYNPQKTSGHKPANSYTTHTSSGSNYGKTKIGITGGGQTDRYPKSILKFKVVNNDNSGGDKLHPTQKPVPLFEYLIKTYTNEGDVILDNCIGSGTTAVACLNLNRKFIGIEKEEKYVDISCERIIKCIEEKNNLIF